MLLLIMVGNLDGVWGSHGFSPKIGEVPQELKVKTRPT
jgi:hypothetical protein